MSREWCRVAMALCVAILCLVRPSMAQSPDLEQRIELARGWNLISFQVVGPNNGGFAIESLTDSLVKPGTSTRAVTPSAIWAWESTAADFVGRLTAVPDFPDNAKLTTLFPGRGYWISNAEPATLVLRGPAWSAPLEIKAGQWSLIGVPGAVVAEGESFDLSSVFGANIGDIGSQSNAWLPVFTG